MWKFITGVIVGLVIREVLDASLDANARNNAGRHGHHRSKGVHVDVRY